MFDWAVEMVFGTLYGSAVMVIALAAAIPYGIWQGIRWLGRRLTGRHHGDA